MYLRYSLLFWSLGALLFFTTPTHASTVAKSSDGKFEEPIHQLITRLNKALETRNTAMIWAMGGSALRANKDQEQFTDTLLLIADELEFYQVEQLKDLSKSTSRSTSIVNGLYSEHYKFTYSLYVPYVGDLRKSLTSRPFLRYQIMVLMEKEDELWKLADIKLSSYYAAAADDLLAELSKLLQGKDTLGYRAAKIRKGKRYTAMGTITETPAKVARQLIGAELMIDDRQLTKLAGYTSTTLYGLSLKDAKVNKTPINDFFGQEPTAASEKTHRLDLILAVGDETILIAQSNQAYGVFKIKKYKHLKRFITGLLSD